MEISKRKALELINQSRALNKPFDIEFSSADLTRGTGGALKILRKQITCGANHDQLHHGTITVQSAGKKGHPVPVHINLIMKVNGMIVL